MIFRIIGFRIHSIFGVSDRGCNGARPRTQNGGGEERNFRVSVVFIGIHTRKELSYGISQCVSRLKETQ